MNLKSIVVHLYPKCQLFLNQFNHVKIANLQTYNNSQPFTIYKLECLFPTKYVTITNFDNTSNVVNNFLINSTPSNHIKCMDKKVDFLIHVIISKQPKEAWSIDLVWNIVLIYIMMKIGLKCWNDNLLENNGIWSSEYHCHVILIKIWYENLK